MGSSGGIPEAVAFYVETQPRNYILFFDTVFPGPYILNRNDELAHILLGKWDNPKEIYVINSKSGILSRFI